MPGRAFEVSRREFARGWEDTPSDVARRFAWPSGIVRRVAVEQRPRPFSIDVQPGVRDRTTRPAARARRLLCAWRPLSPAIDGRHDGDAGRRGRRETSPWRARGRTPAVLCAALEAGATRVLRAGGAQAIAALAYGTRSIARVDKIVGPGNAWVAAAKTLVSRDCAIDFQAGPSEIVICSDDGRADWIAADLIAQAEHDPDARAILVTTKRTLARDVAAAVAAQMPRAGPARQALRRHGAIVVAASRDAATRLVNRIAPEHLVCDRAADAATIQHGGHDLRGPVERAGARRLRHGIQPRAAHRRRGPIPRRTVHGRLRANVHRANGDAPGPSRNRRTGDRARSRPRASPHTPTRSGFAYDLHAPPSLPQGLRLHLNENTGGCSPAVLAALRSIARTDTAFYPDYAPVTSAAERCFGVPAGWVQLTNGLDEGLHVAAQAAARGRANAAAVIVEPAFEMYAACADAAGLREIHIAPDADFTFPLQQILDAATHGRASHQPDRSEQPDRPRDSRRRVEAVAARDPTRSSLSTRRTPSSAAGRCIGPLLDRYRNLIVGPDVCEGAWPGGIAGGRAHRASGHAGAAPPPAAAVQPEHLRGARARGGAGRSRVSRRVRRRRRGVARADLRVLRRARHPLLAERSQLRAASGSATGRRRHRRGPGGARHPTFATNRLRPAATGASASPRAWSSTRAPVWLRWRTSLRRAVVDRRTTETRVRVRLNLDGRGRYDDPHRHPVSRPHARARRPAWRIRSESGGQGDLDVDAHHTVEDTGIALGEAVLRALGTKRGINRAGYFVMPMDETLAVAAIDLSGRPFSVVDLAVKAAQVGDLPTELVQDFFEGFASAARANVHLKVLYGRSSHHQIEAVFKAFARALRVACARDRRLARMLPSTKGLL